MKRVNILILFLLIAGCNSKFTQIGTIITTKPHMPNALFYYYIDQNDIRIEAKIKDKYYSGTIFALPEQNRSPYGAKHQSTLRMISRRGEVVQCHINNHARHIRKGGTGICYVNNKRIFDITLGIARYDRNEKKARSFRRFLAI